jgi:hypothetical protein
LKRLDDFLNCRNFRHFDPALSSEQQQNTAYKNVENAWNPFRVCSAFSLFQRGKGRWSNSAVFRRRLYALR